MRFPWQKKDLSIDDLISQMHAAARTSSGVAVTPENCMRSPTIQAVVTAVSRRLSVSPVKVIQTTEVDGRENKEWLRNHPTQRLLNRPNDYQSSSEYWMDSASSLLRWGNYFAIKLRGNTGPIRRLRPIPAGHVDLDEQALRDGDIRYRVEWLGEMREYPAEQIHHVRTAARDYIWGNSPVKDISDTIGLEIAAEEFGGSFFGNGAMPLLMFLQQKPFKDKEQEDAFLKTFQAMYGGGNQHKALLIPAGIEVSDPIEINNERSQFLATRQYQRTVIAGAFGVPPHLVGDLTSGTFNNVEQQDKDFVINVVLPFARIFENAMERDLLTDADRRNGIIIRFDLDQVQRADFRTRQDGLWRQRQAGVINANDWRERENMNPISEDQGGEDYWQPSNMMEAGADEEPVPTEAGDEQNVPELP